MSASGQTAAPAVPAPRQMVSIDLLDLAEFIRDRPEYHQRINQNILPHVQGNIRRDLLSRFTDNLESLNSALTVIKTMQIRGPEREAAIGDTESYLSHVDDGFQRTRAWFSKVNALMEVLEGSGCLDDGNRASFDDLERSTWDFDEDIQRVKEELEGLKLAW